MMTRDLALKFEPKSRKHMKKTTTLAEPAGVAGPTTLNSARAVLGWLLLQVGSVLLFFWYYLLRLTSAWAKTLQTVEVLLDI